MHRSGVCACAGSLCPKMTPYPGSLYKQPGEWSPIACVSYSWSLPVAQQVRRRVLPQNPPSSGMKTITGLHSSAKEMGAH